MLFFSHENSRKQVRIGYRMIRVVTKDLGQGQVLRFQGQGQGLVKWSSMIRTLLVYNTADADLETSCRSCYNFGSSRSTANVAGLGSVLSGCQSGCRLIPLRLSKRDGSQRKSKDMPRICHSPLATPTVPVATAQIAEICINVVICSRDSRSLPYELKHLFVIILSVLSSLQRACCSVCDCVI